MGPASKSLKNYSVNTPADASALHIVPLCATVPVEYAGLRSDTALAQMFPEHSRSRLAAWLRAGRITFDGSALAPKAKVWGGEQVTLYPEADAHTTAFRAENIPIDVVYEDEHLMVINKPAGLVVHPGSGNWHGTLLNALLQHAPQLEKIPRAGIVHRLDKDTSGLLVVAKTLSTQTALVRALQTHAVTRVYVAVVHGQIAAEGSVDAPIGRHKTQRTRMAVVPGGKPALTHYEPMAHYLQATQLRCRLETGRTHQIRVHLASIGHPIIGDPVYGARKIPSATPAFGRQALHAHTLALTHPATRRRRSWSAPLPTDMKNLIATLESDA